MSHTRQRTLTQKVQTDFAPLYVHLQFNDAARPCAVWVSSPGKLRDTTVESLLESIAAHITDMLESAWGGPLSPWPSGFRYIRSSVRHDQSLRHRRCPAIPW